MATAEEPRVKKKKHGTTKRHKRSHRLRRRALFGLGTLALLVYLAPIVVAKTGLRNTLLAMAVDEEQGSITAGGASLGWFSPIELEDIEILDSKGESIATVHQAESEKTLFALATNRTSLGTFTIKRPDMHIELRERGSNLEDFAAPWFAPSDDPTTPVEVEVQIEDGTVELTDVGSDQTWKLEDVSAAMRLAEDSAVSAEVTTGIADAVGTIAITAKLPAGENEPADIKLEADALPLAILRPILSRAGYPIEIHGALTAKLAYRGAIDGSLSPATIRGQATCDDLDLRASALGGDRLKLHRLHVPVRVTIDGRRIKVEQLEVDSDVGHVELDGTFAIPEGATRDAFEALARETFSVSGELDVARLAALLPETMRIRDDTQIRSGEVTLDLTSKPVEESHRWHGQLQASRLAATSGGRDFVWQQPIQVSLDAHAEAAGVTVDKLECVSDFLRCNASGTPDAFEGTANFDLDQLVAQVSQFIDLGQWRLAGTGEGTYRWSRTADERFTAAADFAVREFELAGPQRPPWSEPELRIDAEAAGRFDEGRLVALDKAEAVVTAGEDRLAVRLPAPVSQVSADANWPMQLDVKGALARWLRRARPWVPTDGWQIEGNCDLVAHGAYSAAGVEIDQATAVVKKLQVQGGGLAITEPIVELQVAGRWIAETSRLELSDSTFASPTVSMRADRLTLELAGDAPKAEGAIAVHGQLDRLQQWFETPETPLGWRLAGTASGNATLNYQAGKTGCVAKLDVAEPRLWETPAGKPPRVVWQDARMTLIATASYDLPLDRLLLEQTNMTTPTLSVAANGSIDKLTQVQQLDLTGEIGYDLANFTPLLRSYLGENVGVAGRDTAQFKIRGPLAELAASGQEPAHWSRRLNAEADFGWQKADVHGLIIGKARTSVRLADGSLRLGPLDIPVGEGRLTTAPWVRFDPQPAELYLPKGQMLQRVRISPEICDNALKYIAPVLAQATRTEGRFSLELDGGRVPLANYRQSDIAGRLAVHKLEVMPGPLAAQMILLGKQIEAIIEKRVPPSSLGGSNKSLLNIDDQTVGFRMVQGRVYHEGLQFRSGDVVVRTRGSVGLDQTLALVADIPFQDKWAEKTPELAPLRGQTISVGIGGTFRQPVVDPRPLQQLAARLVQESAQRVIGNELDKQLDRLFRRR